jgi:hypothetical protein
MPYKQYYYVKMAVDFEMLRQRKLFISDVASAFSDPQKGVKQLEKQETQLSMIYRKSQTQTTGAINWDFPDESPADKLRKWQR